MWWREGGGCGVKADGEGRGKGERDGGAKTNPMPHKEDDEDDDADWEVVNDETWGEFEEDEGDEGDEDEDIRVDIGPTADEREEEETEGLAKELGKKGKWETAKEWMRMGIEMMNLALELEFDAGRSDIPRNV